MFFNKNIEIILKQGPELNRKNQNYELLTIHRKSLLKPQIIIILVILGENTYEFQKT